MSPRQKRNRETPYDPTVSRGILAILFTILAILVTLSFFGRAGAVGIAINEYLLASLFGGMRYALPAVFLIIAWHFVKNRERRYRVTHIAGAVLFLLSASSFLHLHFPAEVMWTEAISGNGGGIFGMGAFPLKAYIGIVGSIVILGGLFGISMLLTFNTSISVFLLVYHKLLKRFSRIVQRIGESLRALVTRQPSLTVHGSYDTSAGSDADDEGEARRFAARNLTGHETEDDKEDDEESNENEEREEEEETAPAPEEPAGPWAKKVVIRNLPSLSLLSNKRGKPTSGDIKANAEIIRGTLHEFGIDVEIGEIRVGPAVTQYALRPEQGIKLSRITALTDNLALALAAHPVRIEAPIPGKSMVGIEVPNQKTALVGFREILESKEFQNRPHHMMIGVGKDVSGKVWWADLPRMPHLLVAGATGTGKTVCVNAIIMSLLFQNTAETLRFIMVDPKRVELTVYNGIPHLLTPVITNVQNTVNALKWTIGEMERRFEVLEGAGNRDILSYNAEHQANKMPHIVFVIDELATLMQAAASEIEAGIIRVAQMARAVGIHLVVATQRPDVNVITGLMKANIPARIALSVASMMDSRVILDTPGAEKLLGRGDMLFQTAELSKPVRLQGAFISEEELKSVVEHLKGGEAPDYDASIVEKTSGAGTMSMFGGPADDQDPLFGEAKAAILSAGKASASFLQRKLKVGYSRAARLLDELEAAGVIGPGEGAKPREILVTETVMDTGGEFNVFDEDTEDGEEEHMTEESGETVEEEATL